MTKEEFKRRWKLNETGGNLTFDDIAECAKSWGICQTSRIKSISQIQYLVLRAANCKDAEQYKPQEND